MPPDYSKMTDAELMGGSTTTDYSKMSDAELMAGYNPPAPETPAAPESRGLIGETVAGFKRGGLQLVDMAGNIARAVDPVGGVDTVRDAGFGMSKFAKGRALQSDVAESDYASNHPILGNIPKAAEMLIPSVGIPAAIGLGTAAVGLSAPVAAGVGIVGAGLAFGTSQFQDTKERGLERGLTEEQATTAGIKTGLSEGVLEAASNVIPAAKFLKLGKPVAGQVIKSLFGAPTFKAAAKTLVNDAAQIMVGEVSTEMAQAYTQGLTEKNANIRPDADPWQEAKDVVGPTIALSLMLGGVVGGANKLSKVATQHALTNQNVGEDARTQAAGNVYSGLVQAEADGYAPAGSADNFRTNAAEAIKNKAPLALSDELLQPPKAKVDITQEDAAANILDKLVNGASPSEAVEAHNAEVAGAKLELDAQEVLKQANDKMAEELNLPELPQTPPELSTPLSTPVENLSDVVTSEPATTPVVESQDVLEQIQAPAGIDPATGEITDEPAITDPLDLLKPYKNKEAATKELVKSGRLDTHTTKERSDGQTVIVPKEVATPVAPTELATQNAVNEVINKLPVSREDRWDDGTHIEFTPSPFTKLDGKVDLPTGKDTKAAVVTTISLEGLRSTQDEVTLNGLRKERDDSFGLPLVVQSNGIRYIQDGHHRLSVEKLAGGTEAQVRFVNLDSKNTAKDAAPTPVVESPTAPEPSTTFTPEETQHFLNGLPSQYRDAKGQAELLGIVNSNITRLKSDLDFEDIDSPEAESIQKSLDGLAQSKAMLEHLSEKGTSDVKHAGDVRPDTGATTTDTNKRMLSEPNFFSRSAVERLGAINEAFRYPDGTTLPQGALKESKNSDLQSKLSKIAGVFGHSVTLLADFTGRRGNGFWISADTKHVYIYETGSDKPLAVLGHELVHHMSNLDNALYKELGAAFHKLMNVDGMNKYMDKYFPGEDKASVPKLITEEWVGDVLGHSMGNRGFWDEFSKVEPSLAARVARFVHELIQSVKDKLFSGRVAGSAQTIKDFKAVDKIAADVMRRYAQRLKKAAVAGDSDAVKELSAWHGSPHDHDKFSMDKVGTGEGAQAYGYGLYFAGSKKVAEWYRESLSHAVRVINIDGKEYPLEEYYHANTAEGRVIKSLFNSLDAGYKGSFAIESARNKFAKDADALAVLEGMSDAKYEIKKGGKLYQVELAPKEDEYLLWDKPLSEQSEKVQDAYKKVEEQYPDLGVPTGDSRIKLPNGFGDLLYGALENELGSDRAASEYLHSLGIRGIQYADGSTRNKEDQNFNYVIFNDEDVSITMKFLAGGKDLDTSNVDAKINTEVSQDAREKFTASILAGAAKEAQGSNLGAVSDELRRMVGERNSTAERGEKGASTRAEGGGVQTMAGVYDGEKVGSIKSLPSDTARGRAIAHMSNLKSELELQGFEVSGIAFEGTGSYQYVVSRDGLPLLQMARTIKEPLTDGEGYTAKLDFGAGLQSQLVDGELRPTSLGAYDAAMWAELDSLSQLVDSVEVVLLGHGSAAWWTKNIDPKAEQGNKATATFNPTLKKELPIRNTAAHAKLSKEVRKNEWQPTYAPFYTGTIREAAYDERADAVVYRSGVADEEKNVQGGVTLKRSGSAEGRASRVHKGSGDTGATGLDGATEAEIDSALTMKFLAAEEAGATTEGQKEKAAKLWAEKGVESPFFKKWFGGSKVVDAEGKPLVVYHGTESSFDEFKDGVAYFTPRQDYGYIQNSSVVVPTYLQLVNPYYPSVQSELEQLRSNPERVAELKELGYDGAVWAKADDIMRGASGWGNDLSQIAVFSPTQIKSAIGNNGEFDGTNPSIKFLAGEPKSVNSWFKGGALRNTLGDAFTASMRYIMPTDRTIGMALTQAMYKPIYRHLKQYLDLRQKKAGHVQAIMTNAHVAAQMLEKSFNAAEMKSFSTLVFDATEMQLHADGANAGWTAESWEKAGMQEKFGTLKEAQAKLTARYNKLIPEQKQAHSAMLQQLQKVYLEGREAALAPFKASFPDIYAKAEAYNQAVEDKAPVAEPAKEVADLAATIKHVTEQYPLLRGDYMPLMRFGKYLVRTVEQDENGETGKRTRTEFFDSQSEAIAYAERINSSPTNLLHAEVELSKSLGDRGVVNIPAIMIDKLRSAAESRGMSGEALEQLIRDAEALRINMMPRTSTSGNKLQREGVEGYNTNVMKVFASYISNHANANAGILYGTQMEQAFRDMGNAIKAYRSEPGYDIKGAIEQDTLYKHLYENEKSSSKVKINDLTKNLGKASFLWYLSSPSIWAVQWSQPFMVTVPKMAARYGYSKALKAYSAAAKRYLHGDFSDEKIFNFNREHEFVGDRIYDLIAKSSEDGADIKALNRQINDIFGEYKDAKEQRLIILKVLSLQGRIDLSMSHNFQELAASTNSGDAAYDKLTKLGSKGMEKASFFMQHSETGSRRAAAVASFELALGKDNFIEANNYASSIINDTLFDFDSGNRGKAWQGNTGHILGQFQFFRLHMLGKMLQLGKDAIGGEYKRALAEATTQEEKDAALAKRNESRKELAYMTSTSMALAGAAGTPLALAFGNSLSSAMFAAIGMLFGDDDDPWDVAKDLENGVREVLGDTAGNVILKGLPSLIGMDISKRIGLGGIGNIVMGDPPAGAGPTAKANWYAGRLLGPAWGMVSDTMRAGDALAKGDITQAVQYSSPKVLRDFIKMTEMADHGVQGGGKTLLKPEDVSPYSYALMMVGINPLEVSLASEESRYLKNLSTSLSQRRSGLINKLAVATADSDSDAKDSAIEGINSWSEKNPKLRITAQELLSGIKRERGKRSGRLTPKEQLVKAGYAQ